MPRVLRSRMTYILENNVHLPGVLLGLSKNKMKHISYLRAYYLYVCFVLPYFSFSRQFFHLSFYQNAFPAVVPPPRNFRTFFSRDFFPSAYKLKKKIVPLKIMKMSPLITVFIGLKDWSTHLRLNSSTMRPFDGVVYFNALCFSFNLTIWQIHLIFKNSTSIASYSIYWF